MSDYLKILVDQHSAEEIPVVHQMQIVAEWIIKLNAPVLQVSCGISINWHVSINYQILSILKSWFWKLSEFNALSIKHIMTT